jgi:hypothetical protein
VGGGGVQAGQVVVADPDGRAPRADDLRVITCQIMCGQPRGDPIHQAANWP